jgi:hypothetical protein
MYEYKFVEADLGGFFTASNHREIIERYAKEGWRLVQVLPTNYNSHGKPAQYDIIFEKHIENSSI